MFQTFSGNSRRPRHVNLSGQNLNPFAASTWSPSASGTQQTVAHAQQERQQRQQERDRLNASKHIQRTWRGYKTRRDLADSRRETWDELVATGGHETESELIEALRLLPLFFSPRRRDDIDRLTTISSRISLFGLESLLSSPYLQSKLVEVAHVALEALQL